MLWCGSTKKVILAGFQLHGQFKKRPKQLPSKYFDQKSIQRERRLDQPRLQHNDCKKLKQKSTTEIMKKILLIRVMVGVVEWIQSFFLQSRHGIGRR